MSEPTDVDLQNAIADDSSLQISKSQSSSEANTENKDLDSTCEVENNSDLLLEVNKANNSLNCPKSPFTDSINKDHSQPISEKVCSNDICEENNESKDKHERDCNSKSKKVEEKDSITDKTEATPIKKGETENVHDQRNDDFENKMLIKENKSKLAEKNEKKRRRRRSRERSSESFNKAKERSRSRSLSISGNENSKSSTHEDHKMVKSNSSTKPSRSEHPDVSMTARQRRTVDLLTSRTGGAYIPPAKLRLLQAEITDKSSAAYQRIAWEALKKSIHGYINKVNVDNIGIITRELLKENIIRGRGLLCRSIIQAQAASPTFTHVYAALVAIINSKFPNIGELLLKRLVLQFKRGFRRNDKIICLSSARFIAHLVNQRVAHEILALEILTLLVENPTDDSVEVAIAFLRECGMKLTEVSSKGISAIFDMLKNILHEGKLDKRVQYMIEVVFQVRKDGFKDHQSVIESLELVEEDDQFTHLISLDEAAETQDSLNVFKFDEKYQENENKYSGLSKELLGSEAEDSGSGSESDSGESDSNKEDDENKKSEVIIDSTETNLVALRRTIYLTIHSSLDYEECAHKLMKMELKTGQEPELCHMFLDCCAEQRTYEKFYGLLAQRFCAINKIYIESFEEIFKATYSTTHRLDTNRLRNVSKFFAHLLYTNAIGWDVLECINLNEVETTSSSRIFIKILFQELAEYMGLSFLNAKLKDPELVESFSGLFPRDNPKNTRFAINFFTSIGLGGLTDDLRQFLKSSPKVVPNIITGEKNMENTNNSSSSSTSDSSNSESSGSSSESSTSDSSTENESKTNSGSKTSLKKKNKKNGKIESNKKKSSNKKLKKKRKESSSSDSSSDSESSTCSSSSTSSSSTSSSSSDDYKKTNQNKSKKNEKNIKKNLERTKPNPFRNNDKEDSVEKYRSKNHKRETKRSEESNKDKHRNYNTHSSTSKIKRSENSQDALSAFENSKTQNEKKTSSEARTKNQKRDDRKFEGKNNETEKNHNRSKEKYERDSNNEARNEPYKHEKRKHYEDDKRNYKENNAEESRKNYKKDKEKHSDRYSDSQNKKRKV